MGQISVNKGYGAIFKKIREERNISLKEAAGSIITPQALGKFERGETQIKLDNFGRLLISIGVSWYDFIRECPEESIDALFFDREIIELCDSVEEVVTLRSKKREDATFRDNPLLKTCVFDLELYSYSVDVRQENLTPTVTNLYNYINNRYFWYELDWYIFAHTINLFETDAIEYRSKNLLKSLQDNMNDLETIATSVSILNHVIKVLRNREEYALCNFLITELDNFYETVGADLLLNYYLSFCFQKSYTLLKQGKAEAVEFTENLYKELVYLEKSRLLPIRSTKNKERLVAEALRINKTGLKLNF
ncbi:TPA: helix-turn-helix domain-containing protein [Streptococcus suis]